MAHREFLDFTEFVVPPYPRAAAGITACGVYRPFPKLWLVNPDDRSQIVCDYELSRWAVALGLARCRRRRRPPSLVAGCQALFLGPRSPATTHGAAGHDGSSCGSSGGGGGGGDYGNGALGRAALAQ